MQKIIVINNPCLNYKYYTEIEFETGRIIYKTNVTERNNDYECFFLLSKEKLSAFLREITFLDNWQPSYNVGDDILVLDGFHWKIKIIASTEKEIVGANCKPKEFDYFINKLELLLQKDFGGKYA